EIDELSRVVLGEIRRETLLELLELRAIRGTHPSRGHDVHAFEHAVDAVLVLEAERRDVELQRTDRAQDEFVARQRPEQLRRSFLAELRESFLQRFQLQRIPEHGAAEQLGREIRNAREHQALALGEAVADVDRAVIVQPDDVARVRLLDVLPIRGHERDRVGDANLAAEADVVQFHSGTIAARANAHERDPVAVRGIHVRLDLEDESRERGLERIDATRLGVARQRRRRVLDERVEQLLDAYVVDRGTAEDRRLLAREIARPIERAARAADQLDLFDDPLDGVAEPLSRRVRRDPVDALDLRQSAAVSAVIEVDPILEQVIETAKLAPHADRPGDGRALDLQHRLDLVEQLERRAPVAVELVDERDDRRRAQTADVHQLDRAFLGALRGVDDHQRAVD